MFFRASGRELVTAAADGGVRLWDVRAIRGRDRGRGPVCSDLGRLGGGGGGGSSGGDSSAAAAAVAGAAFSPAGVGTCSSVGDDALLYGGPWIAALPPPSSVAAGLLASVRVVAPSGSGSGGGGGGSGSSSSASSSSSSSLRVAGVALMPAARLLLVGCADGRVLVCR